MSFECCWAEHANRTISRRRKEENVFGWMILRVVGFTREARITELKVDGAGHETQKLGRQQHRKEIE
jgi:hypothetical protein